MAKKYPCHVQQLRTDQQLGYVVTKPLTLHLRRLEQSCVFDTSPLVLHIAELSRRVTADVLVYLTASVSVFSAGSMASL